MSLFKIIDIKTRKKGLICLFLLKHSIWHIIIEFGGSTAASKGISSKKELLE